MCTDKGAVGEPCIVRRLRASVELLASQRPPRRADEVGDGGTDRQRARLPVCSPGRCIHNRVGTRRGSRRALGCSSCSLALGTRRRRLDVRLPKPLGAQLAAGRLRPSGRTRVDDHRHCDSRQPPNGGRPALTSAGPASEYGGRSSRRSSWRFLGPCPGHRRWMTRAFSGDARRPGRSPRGIPGLPLAGEAFQPTRSIT